MMNKPLSLLAAVALGACSTDPPPPPVTPVTPAGPITTAPIGPIPSPAPTMTVPPAPMCRLPAPVKSDDACASDADCGPSEPCHARACVARQKSRPKGPDTMCTMKLDCASVDVNRCGCFEGRCALIPPNG